MRMVRAWYERALFFVIIRVNLNARAELLSPGALGINPVIKAK